MNLVWDGRRYVNLDFLVFAEDADGPPGPEGPPNVRMMLNSGLVISCGGEPAAAIWRRLRELANGHSLPPAEPPEPVSIDPASGSILPARDPRPESA